MLAIVVAVPSTTRAPQIVLNKLMLLPLMSAANARAAASAQLYPPTVLADPCRIIRAVGRLAGRMLGQAPFVRYAISVRHICG